MLEHAGYRITATTSSREALTAFAAEPNRYDLVITDLTMPYLTGSDLASAVLKLRPGIPIILTTGFGGSMKSAKVLALGIREMVLKPLTAQTLTESVQRVLTPKKGK